MGTKEKLAKRLLSFPADFTFDELETLLAGFGYAKSNKGKTSGSRVIYKDAQGRPIMIHRPHPGNIVKGYALRQIVKELRTSGKL